MKARSCLLVPALAAALLLPALVAAPAAADDPPVDSLVGLEVALADCSTDPTVPNVITLGAHISAPAAQLTTSCTTTINLGAYNLTVRNIVIAAGTTLEITGPADGSEGTLAVNAAGVASIAGIQNTGATFKVTGAAVHATGGHHGAAIGGQGSTLGGVHDAGTLRVAGGSVHAVSTSSYGAAVGGGHISGNGGTIEITGGTVHAETTSPYGVAVGGGAAGGAGNGGSGADITVSGGTLTATATGLFSTAIGGGLGNEEPSVRGGVGGALTIDPDGTVTASSPRSALGGGIALVGSAGNGDFGQVQVNGTLHLPSGNLRVGSDPAVTNEIIVGATGRILGDLANPTTGANFIAAGGTINNQGVIALTPPATMVTGNNRLITFDTSDPDIRVFAPSFDTSYRTLPPPPTGTLWNTAPDGTGAWFATTTSTTGTGTTALYSLVPGAVQASSDPADLTATAGEPYSFPVTAFDAAGTPLSPQPAISYTSPDCVVTGTDDVFESVGECTIEAASTIQGVPVTTTFTIEVISGPAQSLALTPSATTVAAGGTLSFAITGEDAYGNPVDTSAAVLTSSVATDEISGHTVTFAYASPHTITASLDDATAHTTIEVIPAHTTNEVIPTSGAGLSRTGAEPQAMLWLASLILLGMGGAGVALARHRKRNRVQGSRSAL